MGDQPIKYPAHSLNFAVAPTKIPVHDYVEQTELACTKLNPSQAAALRNEIAGALKSAKPPKPNITMAEKVALKEIQENKDIMILPADKGRATVILDKAEYEQKMEAMLSDRRTYEVLKKDPSKKYKDKLVAILQRLQEENKISEEQYKDLYPTTSHIPRIYGSPKVHKTGCPLRPIVEGIGSCTYKVAKALLDILRPIEGDPEFHIKDSKDFVNKISDLIVLPDELLMSHDVVSLFTNVDINMALDITRNKLQNDHTLKKRTRLSVNDIIELLSLVLNTTYFQYNGRIYKQKFGAAMGGPCSPVIANIVMDYLFRKCQEVAPENVRPRVALKFVDDSFEVVKRAVIQALTELMNKLDATGNLKFTDEVEEAKKLPFLDSLVHRNDDGTLFTTVYRKPTHTDQYLNFNSHHPIAQRRGVVRTLMDRAQNLCTREQDKVEERAHVKQALVRCGYPAGFIDNVVKKTAQSRSQATAAKPKKKQDKKGGSMVTVPYLKGLSEKCMRIYSKYNVKTALKPACSLPCMLVRPKDSSPMLRTSDCVYCIPCGNCNEVYIGETGTPREGRI